MALTWPGMINGRIPLDQMVDVVGDGAEGSHMNPAAGWNFRRMQLDCLRDLGKTFGTEEAYRSYETQEWYAGPNSPLPKGTAVAAVGTSKHGWGRANDITGYNDPDIWAWLMEHEEEYGFSWEEGRNSKEKWHHVYVGSLDPSGLDFSIFDKEEDDMYGPEQRNEVVARLDEIIEQGRDLKQWLLNTYNVVDGTVFRSDPAQNYQNSKRELVKGTGKMFAAINGKVINLKDPGELKVLRDQNQIAQNDTNVPINVFNALAAKLGADTDAGQPA